MTRDRDTIFLWWMLLHRQLSTQPTRGARSAQSRLASPSSESRLSRSEAGTQLTDFFQISKSSAHTSGHDVIHTSGPNSYLWFSFWHLLMTHPLRARITPALMLHLTNPCAKRKVLSLTKPKGKIYKTKSLGNYITLRSARILRRVLETWGDLLSLKLQWVNNSYRWCVKTLERIK